jgi:hypothetical protein
MIFQTITNIIKTIQKPINKDSIYEPPVVELLQGGLLHNGFGGFVLYVVCEVPHGVPSVLHG